jgi:hypothetical protein
MNGYCIIALLYNVTLKGIERSREVQAGRQTDRQAGRQTDTDR